MEAGADCIAPYFNRMENMGINSDDVIASLAEMIDLYHYNTEILAASFKNAGQVDRAFLAGAQTATMEDVYKRQRLFCFQIRYPRSHPCPCKGTCSQWHVC